MARLGQLLLQADLVSENNLARALGMQQYAGGRIGTLLLERGSVNEDDLGRTLALQHACEYVPWNVLDAVSAITIAALPAKFAIKHSAVPYDRGEGSLRVALRDPTDLRILDELFFVTGRKILPAVAPEVRIYQALEKYYGERRTPRFAILAEKLSRTSKGLRASPPPPPAFTPETPDKPAPLLTSQELWGEAGEPDLAEPSIIQSWKIPDRPLGGWAGTASPAGPVDTAGPESITWEELMPTPTHFPKPEAAEAPSMPPPTAASVVAEPSEKTLPIDTARILGEAAFRGKPQQPGARASQEKPDPALSPSATALPPSAASPPPPEVPPQEAAAASPDGPFLAAPEGREPPAPPEKVVPEAPTGIASASDFPEVLAAGDRDSIATAALLALSSRFPRCAIFAAKPKGVSGWGAAGQGVSVSELRSVEIPWTEPSVFLNVRLSRAFYLGPLPPLPRHSAIAHAMGDWPVECLVQPVFIREKPVAFFYVEFYRQQGGTPLDLAYLRALASAASSAFVEAIRLKKKEI